MNEGKGAADALEIEEEPERDVRAELSAALIRCTPKQRKWLRALPDHDYQKWAAAERLGYNKRTVHRWLRDSRVKEVLTLLDEIAVDELEITNRFILKRLKQIAGADNRKLYTQQEISTGNDAGGNAKTRKVDVLLTSDEWPDDVALAVVERSYNEAGLPKIKLADPLRALEMLAKWRRLITDRHELTGPNGEPLSSGAPIIQFVRDDDPDAEEEARKAAADPAAV